MQKKNSKSTFCPFLVQCPTLKRFYTINLPSLDTVRIVVSPAAAVTSQRAPHADNTGSQHKCWHPGFLVGAPVFKRMKNAQNKIRFRPAVLTPAVSAGISGIPEPVPEFRPDLTTKPQWAASDLREGDL
jgi:hypothetical protein